MLVLQIFNTGLCISNLEVTDIYYKHNPTKSFSHFKTVFKLVGHTSYDIKKFRIYQNGLSTKERV